MPEQKVGRWYGRGDGRGEGGGVEGTNTHLDVIIRFVWRIGCKIFSIPE